MKNLKSLTVYKYRGDVPNDTIALLDVVEVEKTFDEAKTEYEKTIKDLKEEIATLKNTSIQRPNKSKTQKY